MEKISIIVPVYNVEDYIEDCLESLIAQTYTNIEIILVDDGSADRSADICKEYVEKYSIISLYQKENGGLSDARNYGIRMSDAQNLMFVDADDTLTPDACELLIKTMRETNADVVIGDIYQDKPAKQGKDLKVYQSIEAVGEMLRETSFTTSAGGKLFKKKLFEDISFPKGKLYEDFGTIYKLFLVANYIAYIKHDLYYYRIRDNSITMQRFNEKKMHLFEFADEIDAYLLKNCPELMKASRNRRTRCAILFLKEIAFAKENHEKEEQQLLNYVRDGIFSYLFSHYKITGKLFGLACAINYETVVWMMRKWKQ